MLYKDYMSTVGEPAFFFRSVKGRYEFEFSVFRNSIIGRCRSLIYNIPYFTIRDLHIIKIKTALYAKIRKS